MISRRALREFWERTPAAEAALLEWYAAAREARWADPMDVKAAHATASILKARRVVFNIMGNQFRLVVKINYARQILFIRFVGTHAAYDQINANEV